jgi:hypothetical protein
MPCITLQYDPAIGPILTFSIAAASSLAQPGSAPPQYKAVRGLVDTAAATLRLHPPLRSQRG